MKQTDEYIRHFTALANAVDMKVSDLKGYIARAVTSGLEDFWGSHPWYFKEYEYELSLSSAAESYNLSTNVESVSGCREGDSTNGTDLVPLLKGDFDALAPKPGSWSSGTSRYYCVWANRDRLRISFLPTPSGAETFTLMANAKPGSDTQIIPERFQMGVENRIAAHVYIPGTTPWQAIDWEWKGNSRLPGLLARLQGQNSLYHGPITIMPGIERRPTMGGYDWI